MINIKEKIKNLVWYDFIAKLKVILLALLSSINNLVDRIKKLEFNSEGYLSEAPEDGNLYGRQDGDWSEIIPISDITKEDKENKTSSVSGNEASNSLYATLNGFTGWIKNNMFGWLSAKTTPVDDDSLLLGDSEDSGLTKKITLTNFKVFLKSYFDSLYQSILISGMNIKTVNGTSILGSGNLVIGEAIPVASVCFVFDDSYLSQYAMATEFESRAVRFSQAVTLSNLDQVGFMTTAQVIDLQSRGFEVLNHSQSHLDLRDSSSATYSDAIAEINVAHSNLIGLGLTPKGFVSPNSTLKREFMPIIDNLYDNAYTVYHGVGAGITDTDIQVMNSPIYATKMNRASMYQHNVAQCKSIIDAAVATNGIVTFYDHDPGGVSYPTSATLADILEIVDYAILTVGVNNIIMSSQIADKFNSVKTGGGVYTQITEGLSIPTITFTTATLSYSVESKDVKATTDGNFTIKKDGIYIFEVGFTFVISTAVRVISSLEIDGTSVYRNRHNGYGSVGGLSSQAYNGFGFSPLTLVKGQKVKIKIFQDSGSARTISGNETYNFIKVTKIN